VFAYNPVTVPNSKTTLARFPRFYLAQAERLGLDRAAILSQAGLDESELREVDELLAEIRVASDLRFLDFQQHFAAGEMLGLIATSAPQNSGG
jgi:hypothetical protein